jgi:hypothetical protein
MSTVAGVQKSFPLNSDVLAPGSAISLDMDGATDADVALAIVSDKPFPTRPNGAIDLAHIGLTVAGENPVGLHAGPTSVRFEFSAGITAVAGVFDTPEQALAALKLGETGGLNLLLPPTTSVRYLLLDSGYHASGAVSGTHPIGGLGAFTFGVSGAAAGTTAVLHRFPATDGAATSLGRAVRNWKLPRHIDSASKLDPGTWVIAEADGTVAVKLAASLGYNFNFVREAKVAGLSGDIGLKIDAAATATFGLEVSGRYLVVLGRESEAASNQTLRLRLFKLSSHGLQFGLNLKVGVRTVESVAPDRVDDFVSAVFGVHGAQMVAALRNIDRWTDPGKSIGELVAGLVNDRAFELLQQLTGIDPRAAFDAARAKLLDAIRLYQTLPEKVSSELWSLFGELTGPQTDLFKSSLLLLGSPDEAIQKRALLDIVSATGLSGTGVGRVVLALSDVGVLSLLDRLPEVRQTANTILAILNGDVIRKLQALVNERIHLDRILEAANKADFDALDSFLVGRLGAFLNKELYFADLEEVRSAIHLVVGKRQEVYDKAKKALNSRYAFDVAATWQKTTARSAVLDVSLDTGQLEGRQLLTGALVDGDIDGLLLSDSQALQRHAAVLTHDLTRKTTVDVSLPHFSFHEESFNQAMARVSARDDGGHVLMYDATGQDVVSVRNRFRSSLAVSLATTIPTGQANRFTDLRVHSTDRASWSYQLLHAKAGMRREELEAYTRPFIEQYLASQFTGGMALSEWYNQFDRTVENVVHNGPDQFGDVCAAFEVVMPADTLDAWFAPVADVTSAAKAMSRAIQRSLKQIVAFYYLRDIERMRDLVPTASLLTWAAVRPTNGVEISGDNTIRFDAGPDVFWDELDPQKRRLMVDNQLTAHSLAAALPPLRLRLEEAGRHGDLQFYTDTQVPTLVSMALSSGEALVSHLLLFESTIVRKAADALKEIQAFQASASSSPSTALGRLAEFAADITTAFNKLTGDTVFAGVSFRALSQAVFAEASRALSPSLASRPSAMLTLTVLKPAGERHFNLPDFLNGELPATAQDVAVAQRLVTA